MADTDPNYLVVSMDGATPEGGGFVTAGLLEHLWEDIQNRCSPDPRAANMPQRNASRKDLRAQKKNRQFTPEIPFLNVASHPPKASERRDVTYNPVSSERRMIFAGTSSGGWSSLYLAMHEKPDDVIRLGCEDGASLVDFWAGATDAMSPNGSSLTRLLLAAAGQCSFSDNQRMREYFYRIFEDRTLGDLKHNVVITSFQLDNQEPRRRWQPKIFRNFGERDDCHELVVDVALRTAAAPIFLPIYQSKAGAGPCYIDGGIFANNPSMCALAEVVAELRRETEIAIAKEDQKVRLLAAKEGLPPAPRKSNATYLMEKINRIRMLSIGNGFSSSFVDPIKDDVPLDWGYQQWMLDPQNQGRLLNLVWKAGEDAVDYQCRQLLGGWSHFVPQYRRLQPFMHSGIDALRGQMALNAIELLRKDPVLEEEIASTIDWLHESKWVEAQPRPVKFAGDFRHPEGQLT